MPRIWNIKALSQVDDRELLNLLAEGTSLSLEVIFDRKAGHVFGFALSRGLDEMQAADIVEKVFVEMDRQKFLYRSKYDPNSWIYVLTCRVMNLNTEDQPDFREISAQFSKTPEKGLPATSFKNFKVDATSEADLEPLLEKIFITVRASRPAFWLLGLKIVGLHVVVSFFTLMICSQFGFRLFFPGHGVLDLVKQIGPQGSFLFCGFVFLGATFAIARFVLKRDEWLLLKKTRVLFAWVLAFISMAILVQIGTEPSFQMGLMWLLGTYLGAWILSIDPPRA